MQLSNEKNTKPVRENIADRVYAALKDDIFNFRLLPGDRFSENIVAQQLNVSRTPVREALLRLQREGYVDVLFRSGWQIKPFDFRYYQELYDVRILLEQAAIKRLCEQPQTDNQAFTELLTTWCVSEANQLSDGVLVAKLDEQFHSTLVAATGHREMARIHSDITERLRIIRRLDFTKTHRISATYDEHAAILKAIEQQREDHAVQLLKAHILISKAEVQKITLHMLHQAREQNSVMN